MCKVGGFDWFQLWGKSEKKGLIEERKYLDRSQELVVG